MERSIKRNKTIVILQQALRTMALLCASGTLMQAFLAYVGFTESNIYLHATMINAVNVAATLLCSRYADGRSIKRRSAFVQIPNGLLFLCLLPFCFGVNASSGAFLLLLGISLAQSVFTALNTVCEYKLPYHLYRHSDVGIVNAISGVASSILTFLVGILLDFLKKTVSYDRLMLYAFLIAAFFMVAAGVLALCVTVFQNAEEGTEEKAAEHVEKKKKISLLAMFRTPVFYLLLPANITRGIASGCVNVLATVAVALHFENLAPIMVSISAIANLIACVLFGISCRFVSARLPLFIGSLCFLLLPLGLLGSPTLFLVMYAVVYFGRSVVDIAVPSLIICVVDAEIAGPYNAWRMILHTGGMMIATTVAALPFVTPAMLLWATLACSVISGALFFFIPLLRRASPLFVHGRPHLLRFYKR